MNWETNEVLNWFLNNRGLYNLAIEYANDDRLDMLKSLVDFIPNADMIDVNQVD